MKNYYVYILASRRNGTLYVGITADIITRVHQHKLGEVPGFTKKYNVNQLVYYETHEYVLNAIQREKHIKAWKRKWKLQLIEEQNPNWIDLYYNFI